MKNNQWCIVSSTSLELFSNRIIAYYFAGEFRILNETNSVITLYTKYNAWARDSRSIRVIESTPEDCNGNTIENRKIEVSGTGIFTNTIPMVSSLNMIIYHLSTGTIAIIDKLFLKIFVCPINSNTTCSGCQPGFFLRTNLVNINEFECLSCHPFCSTCKGPSDLDCITIPNNFISLQGKSIPNSSKF